MKIKVKKKKKEKKFYAIDKNNAIYANAPCWRIECDSVK